MPEETSSVRVALVPEESNKSSNQSTTDSPSKLNATQCPTCKAFRYLDGYEPEDCEYTWTEMESDDESMIRGTYADTCKSRTIGRWWLRSEGKMIEVKVHSIDGKDDEAILRGIRRYSQEFEKE